MMAGWQWSASSGQGGGQVSSSGEYAFIAQSRTHLGAAALPLVGANGEPPFRPGMTCFKEAIASGRR